MFLPADKLHPLEFAMTNGKKIEHYRYEFAGEETLATALGNLKTVHLVKHRTPGENGVEVWLARERHQFPVKLAIVETDGTRYEQTITRLEFK